MKNKKMVATLASLCLIVVAVVAAVVGVLAAVQQSVNTTFTVSYVAKNVSATVELKAIGPNSGKTGYETDYAAASSGTTSKTFLPMESSTTATLTGTTYTFSWDSTEANFLGKAIYQFKFQNNYGVGGHDLSVTPAIASISSENVEVLTYTSSSVLAASNVRAEWVQSTGALNTETGHDFALVSDSGYTAWESGAITVSANSSTYFYVIVALKNASNSLSLDLGSKISFTLADPTV